MIPQPRFALRFGAALVLAAMLPQTADAQDRPANGGAESTTYAVDSDRSWLRVLVFRGGLLGGFGHNHVISHHQITGSILLGGDPLDAEFTLELAVAGLEVDDAEQRRIAGSAFPGQIPDKDIAGTRDNMLGRKLLDAARFPSIVLRSDDISGSLPDLTVNTIVKVKDADHPLAFPAYVALSDELLVARGELVISHRQLGLKAFKAALGTLRVRDEMRLQYEIRAVRANEAD